MRFGGWFKSSAETISHAAQPTTITPPSTSLLSCDFDDDDNANDGYGVEQINDILRELDVAQREEDEEDKELAQQFSSMGMGYQGDEDDADEMDEDYRDDGRGKRIFSDFLNYDYAKFKVRLSFLLFDSFCIEYFQSLFLF